MGRDGGGEGSGAPGEEGGEEERVGGEGGGVEGDVGVEEGEEGGDAVG